MSPREHRPLPSASCPLLEPERQNQSCFQNVFLLQPIPHEQCAVRPYRPARKSAPSSVELAHVYLRPYSPCTLRDAFPPQEFPPRSSRSLQAPTRKSFGVHPLPQQFCSAWLSPLVGSLRLQGRPTRFADRCASDLKPIFRSRPYTISGTSDAFASHSAFVLTGLYGTHTLQPKTEGYAFNT